MNAAETIAAAIEKLEEIVAVEGLAQASDDPDTLIDKNANWVGEMRHHRLAHDFVTLYRTIDAQLAILRGNLGGAEDFDTSGRMSADEPSAVEDALALAHAILGEGVRS